jgi:hypothetical protein
MPASLSAAQVAQYQRDGFFFPVDCLTPDEVADADTDATLVGAVRLGRVHDVGVVQRDLPGLQRHHIPPHCRLVNDVRVTASLVRGHDDYRHFDPEPRPSCDFDAGSRAVHAAAVERFFESNKLAARRRSGNVGI